MVLSLYNDSLVVVELYPNQEQGLMLNYQLLQALSFLEMIFSTIIVINVMLKIYQNCPASMKRQTFNALLGVFIFSTIGILYVMLGGSNFVPGLNILFNFLGAPIFGISFMREPKMFHVLSFRILRLQIIDTKSGIGVYSYTWKAGKEIGNEDIFSGMVQGISLILQESVKRGTVEEIKLSEGILIIERIPKSSIACVLVASKSTAPLRQALVKFSLKFHEQFHDKLENICDVCEFRTSFEIIKECFPFVEESTHAE
jgi:hypothetical protein